MHVRDFLDLQSTFQARRVPFRNASVITTHQKSQTQLITSSHDQQTLRIYQKRIGKLLQRLVLLQHLLDLTRQRMKPLNDLIATFRERDAVLGQLQRYHQKRNVLRSVRLSATIERSFPFKNPQVALTFVEATPTSGPALICTPQ